MRGGERGASGHIPTVQGEAPSLVAVEVACCLLRVRARDADGGIHIFRPSRGRRGDRDSDSQTHRFPSRQRIPYPAPRAFFFAESKPLPPLVDRQPSVSQSRGGGESRPHRRAGSRSRTRPGGRPGGISNSPLRPWPQWGVMLVTTPRGGRCPAGARLGTGTAKKESTRLGSCLPRRQSYSRSRVPIP